MDKNSLLVKLNKTIKELVEQKNQSKEESSSDIAALQIAIQVQLAHDIISAIENNRSETKNI